MHSARYVLLALFTFTPTLAFAQFSEVDVIVNDVVYPSAQAAFGDRFEAGDSTGPLPLVQAEPYDACDDSGSITNAEEIAGGIALITRGACSFVEKVVNAFSVGAEAVVVVNNDTNDPDAFEGMAGEASDSTDIPVVMVSFNSGQALRAELMSGDTEATLESAYPCGDPVPEIFLSTDVIRTYVYSRGFIGAWDNGCFSGFRFEGDNGLRVGSILVGKFNDGAAMVTGSLYEDSEYKTVSPLSFLAPPFAPPFEGFDEGREVTLYSPLGVSIIERAYARDEDAFIVVDLDLTNTTGMDLEGVYVGLFADWDVGEFEQNLGGFDQETNLLYVYDESGVSTNYFGVAALGAADVSGWTLATDEEASDASLFEGLTTEGSELATPQDVRAVVGVGPFDLAVGETVNARFAIVAGESEEAIIAHAQAAQDAVTVATEETTSLSTFVLGAAYPNPFESRTTLSFTLPTAQVVRLAVYDVLGREVAVLVNGVRAAGAQAVAFDATGLPSGAYLYRLEAGGTVLTRRLTLVR